MEEDPIYEPPAVEEIDCHADVLSTASMVTLNQ